MIIVIFFDQSIIVSFEYRKRDGRDAKLCEQRLRERDETVLRDSAIAKREENK